MKRWTKKQFIEIVNPCGYRYRIWLFFLTHRYVTLLDVVEAKNVSEAEKCRLIWLLDRKFHDRHHDDTKAALLFSEIIKNMRAELKESINE